MDEVYEKLKIIIDNIQNQYINITNEWFNKTNNEQVNLKKHQVRDLNSDGSIYKNINDYIKFINDKCSTIANDLPISAKFKITSRVKSQNSIESKIGNYLTSSHENGKIPIIKCFNDLFGIRVIIDEHLTFEEIYDFIYKNYGEKYKCINSSKGKYKATHIYFKQSNYSFPWELQIWNQSDCKGNFESHKKYKQNYTNWEQETKEGGIIGD